MQPPRLELDHLVVAAGSLEEGTAYIADRLGVEIPPGGHHQRMGTWNRVTSLGNGVYLELIAIDPGIPAPPRPRWFDLDNPLMREILARGPRLVTWVARIADVSALPAGQEALVGEILEMERDDLRWLITVPADGRLPGAGFLPTVIQWLCEPPAERMVDSGCRLERLTLRHAAPDWLRRRLQILGADGIVEVADAGDGPGRIEAYIATPRGTVRLD